MLGVKAIGKGEKKMRKRWINRKQEENDAVPKREKKRLNEEQ